MSPENYNLQNTWEINIKTTDEISLLAWFYEGELNNPILVYFHGNSFEIGERAYRIKRYNDAGFSTLIVGWRGFSGNDGNPTENNLYLDGNSTINWILENTKFNTEDIINYGESLGSGVAVELNLKYNFLCTVLEAPFTSIADLATKRYKIYPTKLLVKDKFDNLSKIDKILSPLLIIHGKKDEVVPIIYSRKVLKLFKKAKKKMVIVKNGDHSLSSKKNLKKITTELNKIISNII